MATFGATSTTDTIDYSMVSGNDGSTDVTAAELEELSDGSATTLHSHAGGSGTMTTVKEAGVGVGDADIDQDYGTFMSIWLHSV